MKQRFISIAASWFVSGDGDAIRKRARAPPYRVFRLPVGILYAEKSMNEVSKLEYWQEWYERCALGLCSQDAQTDLQNFAGRQFRRYIDRYAHRTNAPNLKSPLHEQDAWHLFETRMTVSRNRQGKQYKDWLFARKRKADSTLYDMLTSGAALLMRDVVRDYLRQEYSPWNTISMHSQAPQNHTAMTVENLLTDRIDPSDETAQREFRFLAFQYAEEFLRQLSKREVIVLAAKGRGQSLSDPAVERAAGCGRTILNETYHEAFKRLTEELADRHKTDDLPAVKALVLLTFERLAELCVLKRRKKKDFALSVAESQ